jgi:hypothetical protein
MSTTKALALAMLAAGAGCHPTSSGLAGQIEFTGQPSSITAITYTTVSGDVVTQELAFSGMVSLIVDPQAASQLAPAITQSGGRVIDALPVMGLYTVQVVPGQEAAFLRAMFKNTFVLDGEPTTADVNACISAVDSFGAGVSVCSTYHGKIVEAIADRGGECFNEVDKGGLIIQALDKFASFASDGILRSEDVRLLVKEAESRQAAGQHAVINLSLQSAASVSGDANGARTTCKTTPTARICKSVQQGQKEFLESILAALAAEPASVRNNTLVVIAAGNAGVDLTQVISDLALDPRYAEAFQHVKIVGAADASGAVWQGVNYGGNGTMVYAPGKNVSPWPGCTVSGTSFAAPEAARVMSLIWDAAPSLTSDQVVAALKAALADPACGGALGAMGIIPQSGGVTDPAFIACAQTHGQTLAPPSGGGSGGSGGGGGGGGYDCSGTYGSAPAASGCSVCAIAAHCLCSGTSVSCWYSGSDGYMTSKCSFDAANSGSTSGYTNCIQGIASNVVQHCCPPMP